jgi:hypothetical protein
MPKALTEASLGISGRENFSLSRHRDAVTRPSGHGPYARTEVIFRLGIEDTYES